MHAKHIIVHAIQNESNTWILVLKETTHNHSGQKEKSVYAVHRRNALRQKPSIIQQIRFDADSLIGTKYSWNSINRMNPSIDITIKDITAEAMINRATFYYHFEDIYDLLEKALSEVLLVNLNGELYQNDKLNEENFVSIFTAITKFQKSLSTRCHRGYEDTIARIIREQLEIIFNKMLVKQNAEDEGNSLQHRRICQGWHGEDQGRRARKGIYAP